MAIPKGYRDNFETLQRAVRNGRIALLECQDKATKKPVYVIVAMSAIKGSEEVGFVPFAKMFDGNPYDELNPPNPDGGFMVDQKEVPARG